MSPFRWYWRGDLFSKAVRSKVSMGEPSISVQPVLLHLVPRGTKWNTASHPNGDQHAMTMKVSSKASVFRQRTWLDG